MPKLAVNAQCNELQHIPRRWKRPRRRGRIFSAAALLWVRLPSVGEVERDEQTAATYHQAVVVAHKSNPPGHSGNLPVNTHTVVTYP